MDHHTRSHPRNQAVTIQSSAPGAIEWAAEELVTGSVIALPTDTVYGIAASLAHEEAIERIFAIKGREAGRKLPILLSSYEALQKLTGLLSPELLPLFDAFWPGPVTFVVPTDRALPTGVLSDDGTIAVRVPNHPLAIEVIEKAGGAVACTSANRSNALPALRAGDVEAALGSKLDIILDGGVAPGGIASTIVSIGQESLTVLRKGPVDETSIRLAWENYADRG